MIQLHDYNATVLERTDIAPGLMILRVAPDKPDISFRAGQYTVLGMKRNAPRVQEASPEDPVDPAKHPLDETIVRAYSIASSSHIGEYLEFYITLVSTGALTPRLFTLKPHDRVYVGPKATGWFTLDRVPEDANVLFLATGTGLAPYMSMLRTHLLAGKKRKYVVLHGARASWDLGYRTELNSLARRFGNLTYIPSISRPEEDKSWAGPSGHLQDVLMSGIIEIETGLEILPKDFHVFLCGNPIMIEIAKERLMARGFAPDKGRESGTIHVEEYW